MRFPVAVLASFLSSSSSEAFITLSAPPQSLYPLQMASIPSWSDIQSAVGETDVGQALNKEVELRSQGKGSAHVQNKLRLFDSTDNSPPITLFRDQAGWCP